MIAPPTDPGPLFLDAPWWAVGLQALVVWVHVAPLVQDYRAERRRREQVRLEVLDWIEAEYRVPREFVTLVYGGRHGVRPTSAEVVVPAGHNPAFEHPIRFRITL